jgi:hypothetical protein
MVKCPGTRATLGPTGDYTPGWDTWGAKQTRVSLAFIRSPDNTQFTLPHARFWRTEGSAMVPAFLVWPGFWEQCQPLHWGGPASHSYQVDHENFLSSWPRSHRSGWPASQDGWMGINRKQWKVLWRTTSYYTEGETETQKRRVCWSNS